jgi:hypothetical protein
MADLATAAGTSRSTATRFFAGRHVSLDRALAIWSVLRLEFDTVAKAVEPDAIGPAGAEGSGPHAR